MAKYFWIGLAAVVSLIIVSVLVVDLTAPNLLWDSVFDSLGKVDVPYKGTIIDVVFSELAPGVTTQQRTWLIRKTHAFKYYAELHADAAKALEDYVELLVAAGADRKLTLQEFAALQASHQALIPDTLVEGWLDLAHEAERRSAESQGK